MPFVRSGWSVRALLGRGALAGCAAVVVALPAVVALAGRSAAAAAVLTSLGAGPTHVAFAPGALLGPAGYLLAFPAAAYALRRRGMRGDPRPLVGIAACAALLFASGVMWLVAVEHTPLPAAVALAVLPFMIGDALGFAAAAALSPLRPVTAAWRLIPRGGSPPRR